MIDVSIIKRAKESQAATSGQGVTYANTSTTEADHAATSEKAKEADHAAVADTAQEATHALNADKAKTADEATHALSAADLDADSKTLAEIAKKYLRKDADDTASGLITFLKGLAVGGAKKYGIDAEGVATLLKVIADSGVIGALTNTTLTSEEASIKNLTVTGAAHFFRLIIDEIKASGGSVLVTPANGFKVAKVVKDGSNFNLYFKAEDGERAVSNKWKVGMQAVSMSFNAATGETMNASNHYWWRFVTGVSSEPVTPDWDKEHKYHWITVSGTDAADGSSVPSENDEVAQLGYRIQGDSDPELRTYTDTDGTEHKYCPLQSAIYLSAYDSLDSGLVAPFLAFYRGISDFNLKSHRKTYFDARTNMLVGDVYNIAGMVDDVIISKPVIGYEIKCKVSGVSASQVNYDTIKASSSPAIEFDFYRNGKPYVAKKATVGCYDGEGALLGSLLEVTDSESSSTVMDGGNLYLSASTKRIVCTLYDAGGTAVKELGVEVVRDGESVKVTKTEYKYATSSSATATIDWSKITATTTPPQPSVAQGSYLYVMTIVTYSDGSTTNAISISYCGTNGSSVQVTGTSVTYAVTDKSTQPADSAFTSTSVPAVGVGQYLWSKTVVTYSDGKSTKSYAVSRVGNDGDTGYSLHFAYADSVTYSGSTPTVTNFSTTRQDSSEWLGVNRSLEADDPTDPQAYDWTKIKGEKGEDVYRLEAISSAGLVYHNHQLNTVLSAHVWGPEGEVTDRCTGTFTWYDLRDGSAVGTGKTYTAQATTAIDAYHFRCIYDGEVSKEMYNIVYNGKQLQYNGKNIQF